MTSNVIARVLIEGDPHLSSKNYGAHRDYPKESLELYKTATDKAEELQVTHIISLGDFSYGRFNTLEYRAGVERELDRRNKITNGRHYTLKGNHDSATYGWTEQEYYVNKGIIKPSQNIQLGVLNISMIDFGQHTKNKIITPTDETINLVIAHDFFKFKDTQLPDYGESKLLDEMEQWFGVDWLVCGHIHGTHMFQGIVVKDNVSHPMVVAYPGCMARPAYREGLMPEVGQLLLFTVFDNGKVQTDTIDIPLWEIEKSFNLEQRQLTKEKRDLKHVDVSDIVYELSQHQRTVGNPEEIIMSMTDKKMEYRTKAIELLKQAQG